MSSSVRIPHGKSQILIQQHLRLGKHLVPKRKACRSQLLPQTPSHGSTSLKISSKSPLLDKSDQSSPSVASGASTAQSLRTPPSLHEPPPIDADPDNTYKVLISGLRQTPSLKLSPSVRFDGSPSLNKPSRIFYWFPESIGQANHPIYFEQAIHAIEGLKKVLY